MICIRIDDPSFGVSYFGFLSKRQYRERARWEYAFAFDWIGIAISLRSFFVTPSLLVVGNPIAGVDRGVAVWFHAHLAAAFVSVLRTVTEFGSSEWIAVVLSIAVLFFIFKRWWRSLVTVVIAVPGGMPPNELVKILFHRHRPFEDGWFVDWSG